MAKPSLKSLQAHLSYRFRNRQLLLEALTHSSYAREASDRVRDNERMEFLGDAILNFLVSVRLADTFPQYSEGSLSRARARLVSADTKAALLANAVEALLAALYRDGGLEAAQAFVERFILPADLGAKADELLSIDYKSALQEYLQAQHLHLATYRVANEQGPEHQKTFTVEAAAGENWRALGGGASKKVAEQQAARNLLALIRKKAEPHG